MDLGIKGFKEKKRSVSVATVRLTKENACKLSEKIKLEAS